jgi:hypothetical protein
MFPHPWGFVGHIYKTTCEVISLKLEKNPGKNQNLA